MYAQHIMRLRCTKGMQFFWKREDDWRRPYVRASVRIWRVRIAGTSQTAEAEGVLKDIAEEVYGDLLEEV